MAMPLVGGFPKRDGAPYDEVSPGDVYLHQNHDVTGTIGYLFALFLARNQKRLDRAIRSISGGVSMSSLGTSLAVKGNKRKHGVAGSRKL